MQGVVLALASLLVLHVSQIPLPADLAAFQHESISYLHESLQMLAIQAPDGSPEAFTQQGILLDTHLPWSSLEAQAASLHASALALLPKLPIRVQFLNCILLTQFGCILRGLVLLTCHTPLGSRTQQ